MNRRGFFEWLGKAAAAVGLGYMAFKTDTSESIAGPTARPMANGPSTPRMNGRACRDYRMLSADQSILLDKDIFSA